MVGPKTKLYWDGITGSALYYVYYRAGTEEYDAARTFNTPDTHFDLAALAPIYAPLTQVFLIVLAYDTATQAIGFPSTEVSYVIPLPAPSNVRIDY